MYFFFECCSFPTILCGVSTAMPEIQEQKFKIDVFVAFYSPNILVYVAKVSNFPRNLPSYYIVKVVQVIRVEILASMYLIWWTVLQTQRRGRMFEVGLIIHQHKCGSTALHVKAAELNYKIYFEPRHHSWLLAIEQQPQLRMPSPPESPFNLQTCARPNILALEPYRCARE